MVANFLSHPPNGEKSPDQAVLRIFFDGKGDARKLIGSLIYQLTRKGKSVAEKVRKLIKEYDQKDMLSMIQDYVEAFRAQVAKFTRVFVIIDALDECPGFDGFARPERQGVEEVLRALANIEKINLMVTARTHISPKDVLKQKLFAESASVKISAHKEDLELFVQVRLLAVTRLQIVLSHPRFQDSSAPDWNKRITAAITEAGNGM